MGIWFLSLLINSGCDPDLVEYDSNDLKISIEKGEEWLHNFPLFLGINIKNPPQIAIWTEDMEGAANHRIITLYPCIIMKKFTFIFALLSFMTVCADGQTDNGRLSYTTYKSQPEIKTEFDGRL